MLKTVKNVEDEAGRGVRSLENTIDSIEADLAEFLSDRPPKKEANPEDLIRSTKVRPWSVAWTSSGENGGGEGGREGGSCIHLYVCVWGKWVREVIWCTLLFIHSFPLPLPPFLFLSLSLFLFHLSFSLPLFPSPSLSISLPLSLRLSSISPPSLPPPVFPLSPLSLSFLPLPSPPPPLLSLLLLQGITLASAKAVSAGNSCKQVDVSACANLGRKAVTELLETCKAAASRADNEQDRTRYGWWERGGREGGRDVGRGGRGGGKKEGGERRRRRRRIWLYVSEEGGRGRSDERGMRG